MEYEDTLRNHFLIAMPSLADDNFFHTVTYICEHNREGAMGIVINRTLELKMGELLSQLDIETTDPNLSQGPVYQGGPVTPEQGFILHQPLGDWEATLAVGDDIGLTVSRDILEAIARGDGPRRYLVALGYAGWGGGQLEQEILQNSWLSGPADSEILFEAEQGERWSKAASLLGIDLGLLSSESGHA